MHELPVTQSILDIACQTAQNNGGGKILSIQLVIGDMSSIVDDSVQFYFDVLSKDTPAEGAALKFRREPATARCLNCNHEFNVSPPLLPACPHCDSAQLLVTGGKQFYIESIEVDDGH